MTIYHYSSTDDSAPQIAGFSPAGQLISILDACLVDGYGTISGAGWTKPYSGTNLAAYRPPAGNQCYLRIDNSNTLGYAIPQAYATMSDINTGTEAFTTAATRNWSFSHDNTACTWDVIASDRSFYFISRHPTTNNYACGYFFGDYVCRKPSFPYNTLFMFGNNVTYFDNFNWNYHLVIQETNTWYCRRGWNEIDTDDVSIYAFSLGDAAYFGYSTYNDFPDLLMGDLLLEPIYLHENSSLMGKMPGMYDPMCRADTQAGINNYLTFSGTGNLAGRDLLMIDHYSGFLVFDLTGPWY